MMSTNKKKTIILSLVTLLLSPLFIIGAASLGSNVAYGQRPPGAIGLFGGRLLGYIQCTCSTGHVMYIGPPRPAAVHFVPGFTALYEYGQVKSIGAWQLGINTGPSPCLFFNGWHCVLIPHQGDILIIGTSFPVGSGGGDCAGSAANSPLCADLGEESGSGDFGGD